MTCEQVGIDMAVYVLGALEPAERSALETHLSGCASCRTALAEFAGLPGLLSRLTLAQVEDQLPTPSPRVLEQLLTAAIRHRKRRRHQLLAAAAALIMISAGGASFALSAGAPGGRTVRAEQGLVQATVRLVDESSGTRIMLRLAGVRVGEQCRMLAIGRNGRSYDAGSWYTGPEGYVGVVETAALDPSDIAALRVETLSGQQLINISV